MGGHDPLSVGIVDLMEDAGFALHQLHLIPKVAAAWATVGVIADEERTKVEAARQRAHDATLAAARWRGEPTVLAPRRKACIEAVKAWRRDLVLSLEIAARRCQADAWAVEAARVAGRGAVRTYREFAEWAPATFTLVEHWVERHGSGWDTLGTVARIPDLRDQLDAIDRADVHTSEALRTTGKAKGDARLALRSILRAFGKLWELARSIDATIPPLLSHGTERRPKPPEAEPDAPPSGEGGEAAVPDGARTPPVPADPSAEPPIEVVLRLDRRVILDD